MVWIRLFEGSYHKVAMARWEVNSGGRLSRVQMGGPLTPDSRPGQGHRGHRGHRATSTVLRLRLLDVDLPTNIQINIRSVITRDQQPADSVKVRSTAVGLR